MRAGPPGTTGGAWVQPPRAERRSRRGAGRGCRAGREPGRGHPAPWTHHLLFERGRQCSHLRALGTSGSTEQPSASPQAQASRVLGVLCTPGGVQVTRVESVGSGSMLAKCAVETTAPGTSLAEFPVLRAPLEGRGVALFQRHVFRTDPTGQPAHMHGRALGAPTEGTPRERLPPSGSQAWRSRSFRPGWLSALRKGPPSGHRTRWQRRPGCGRPGTGCSGEGP